MCFGGTIFNNDLLLSLLPLASCASSLATLSECWQEEIRLVALW